MFELQEINVFKKCFVHLLVKRDRNLQNGRYALVRDSNETSRPLRQRDFLDDKSDYKLSIRTMLRAVSHTPIHTEMKHLTQLEV